MEIIQTIEDYLKRGNIFAAQNAAHEALAQYPDNIRIKQLYGLTLIRLGAIGRAQVFLEGLYRGGQQDAETSGLLGRVYKDRWRSSGAREFARLSRDTYRAAFERFHDYYTGINAATMSLVSGERETAVAIAADVRRLIESQQKGFWELATMGEACLLLGDAEAAVHYYADAVGMAGRHYGDINSAYKQVRLLADYLQIPDRLLALLKPPTVLAFAGHMIDHPARKEPRFPEECAEAVKNDIIRILDELDAAIGYTSAACGADILFIEAMLERGAEVHVLLPFMKEDFLNTSVRFAGGHWEERFHRALERATVKYVTEEGYFGSDELFAFTGYMIQGMSILRGRLLSTRPIFLTVRKQSEREKREGGTNDSLGYWPFPDRVRNIDPSDFNMPGDRRNGPCAAAPGPYAMPVALPAVKRSVKSIIFADIVGFSKLQEEQTPYFMYNLLEAVTECIRALPAQPEIINTWGDAIFAVYDRPGHAMEFALVLRNVIRDTEWAAHNLPPGISIRIALHAGPVFVGTDGITGKKNAYGAHINRTARMEPVTLPGCIYASEQFAAMLIIETGEAHHYDYVGVLQLPKGFGSQEIYHITQAEGACDGAQAQHGDPGL